MNDLKFSKWLSEYYIDPRYLSLYRIIYCFIVILFSGLPAYTWIGNAPDHLFTPPPLSVANLVKGFPEPFFFQVFTIAGLVSFFLMAIGFRTKVTSILFASCCIVGHSFWYSMGQIDHTLLWFLAPIVLSQAGWGDYYSYDSTKKQELALSDDRVVTISFWIFLLALTIGFSMFTAGLQKVMGGWLGLKTNASRYYLYLNYYASEKDQLMAVYFLKINSFVFWKLVDYMTIALEIGFLFSVVKARFFRWFVVGGVLFHIVVLLMLNITFLSNLLVYLLFVDWKLFGWVRRLDEQSERQAFFRKTYKYVGGFFGGVSLLWLMISVLNPNYKFMPGLISLFFTNPGSVIPDPVLQIFYVVYTVGLFWLLYRFISAQRMQKN